MENLSALKVGQILSRLIASEMKPNQELIILCIGTDKVTGDSLGPLIGHKLSLYKMKSLSIYGTLDSPVHALNLSDTIDTIKNSHKDPFIIAVDASLGLRNHIGFVSIEKGPLTPGLGVKKALSPIGDISVTGIVNISGLLENMVLQTTRLATVMHLADSITSGIRIAERNNSHLTHVFSQRARLPI